VSQVASSYYYLAYRGVPSTRGTNGWKSGRERVSILCMLQLVIKVKDLVPRVSASGAIRYHEQEGEVLLDQ